MTQIWIALCIYLLLAFIEFQSKLQKSTQHEALQYRLNDRDQENSRLNSQLDQAQRNLDHYRDTVQKQRDQERADFERQLMSLEQTLKQEQQENQ